MGGNKTAELIGLAFINCARGDYRPISHGECEANGGDVSIDEEGFQRMKRAQANTQDSNSPRPQAVWVDYLQTADWSEVDVGAALSFVRKYNCLESAWEECDRLDCMLWLMFAAQVHEIIPLRLDAALRVGPTALVSKFQPLCFQCAT
jgi:hypothetical protein